MKKAAQIVSVSFHPVLIPTLGFILMFQSGFYFSFIPWESQRFVLLVVLFSTAVLPMLAVALLALKPGFDLSMEKKNDRLMIFLFTAAFHYLGFVLLNRAQVYPVFKILLIASALVVIALLLVSLKWKISSHMAALGSLAGAVFTLAFRTGINPLPALILLVLVSGLTGSARIVLAKNTLAQLIAGYLLGLLIFSLVVSYV